MVLLVEVGLHDVLFLCAQCGFSHTQDGLRGCASEEDFL